MYRSVKKLRGKDFIARDGEIGALHDVLFDDETWTVRYLVCDTGGWLKDRLVLLAPSTVTGIDEHGRVAVDLSRDEVEGSPEIDVHKPVSLQKQDEVFERYGWAPAWALTDTAGIPPVNPSIVWRPGPAASGNGEGNGGDPHLRSAREVTGYSIDATDGAIGHVEDVIIGDEAWMIRYCVVDTRTLLPGRKVLLSPEWIREIRWADRTVVVDLERERIRSSPEYERDELLSREYETRLYDYYEKPKYWKDAER